MTKLLYLGFDGLDPDLLERHDAEGVLKDFCLLRSHSPVPITGPAWTSLNTGLSVETHKVAEPWGRTKEGCRTFLTMPEVYFWNYLGAANIPCGVMNVPITWPPKVINGWMVSGPFVPNRKNILFPPDLFDPILAEYYPDMLNEFFENPNLCMRWFGRGKFDPFIHDPDNMSDYNSPGMLRDIGFEQSFQMSVTHSNNRLNIFDQLIKLYPVQAMFYQDSFLDRINHAHTYKPDSVEAEILYNEVLELIQNFITAIGAETVIIVSDHGGHSGHHTDHGVFAIKNQKVKRQKSECSIIDVLPTTLFAMGIYGPIYRQAFDGQVKYEIFMEEGEEREIEKQLIALGYI